MTSPLIRADGEMATGSFRYGDMVSGQEQMWKSFTARYVAAIYSNNAILYYVIERYRNYAPFMMVSMTCKRSLVQFSNLRLGYTCFGRYSSIDTKQTDIITTTMLVIVTLELNNINKILLFPMLFQGHLQRNSL